MAFTHILFEGQRIYEMVYGPRIHRTQWAQSDRTPCRYLKVGCGWPLLGRIEVPVSADASTAAASTAIRSEIKTTLVTFDVVRSPSTSMLATATRAKTETINQSCATATKARRRACERSFLIWAPPPPLGSGTSAYPGRVISVNRSGDEP
jgi:hypothetical protein